MRTMFRFVLLLTVLLLVGMGAYFYLFSGEKSMNLVMDFASCEKRYPVMETYPRQCVTPSGQSFIEQKVTREVLTYTSSFGDYTFEYYGQNGEHAGYVLVEPDIATTSDLTLMRVELWRGDEYEEFASSNDAREAPPHISVTTHADTGDSLVDWAKRALEGSGAPTSSPELTTLAGSSAVRVSGSGLYLFDTVVVMNKGKVYELRGEYMDLNDTLRNDFVTLLGSWTWLSETSIENNVATTTSTTTAPSIP